MKKFVLIISILVLSQSGFSFFKTQGKKILDNQGNEIQLRGMGLGGWLVPEGYMLHTPGYGSPSYIDSLVVDLIGVQNAGQFWQDYRDNYVNFNDVQQIANWGFNSIRLPFHYKLFYDTNTNTFDPAGFALVDTLLSWCKQTNLYLILDMHCAPGGQNKDNISDSDGIEARLWTEPANQQLTIKIWKRLAETYQNETQIIGYDLINEPVLPDGYSNTHLYNLYKAITDTIRTVDVNHVVFVEGNWYATDFTHLTPPFDNNMVYSFHKYWSAVNVGSIQYLLDISNQYNVPLWMGESGENSNHWYYESVRMYEQQGIGWCWWTHKKLETITSPLSAKMNGGYQNLIKYWNGEISRPTQQYAMNALNQMANNLRIELCDVRPGVIPALFNPDFGNFSEPFKYHEIPGTINAVDYDLGAQAVGYSDNTFQNVAGSGSWNNGWQYRNDGVDIEESSDPEGFAYNVGWISDNEWLKYTVNIQSAGEYNAIFRTAAQSGNGMIRLYLDGQQLVSDISVPNTGGWQNWANITVNNINLPAGEHLLHLSFPSGGFNLNHFKFMPVVTVNSEVDNVVSEFQVYQNYPNPFNSETRIKFEIPKRNQVQIKIFDHLGREVDQILNKELSAGPHAFSWSAANFSSGFYYFQIKSGNYSAIKKMMLIN